MAQYPFLVSFAEEDTLFRYIVRANDAQQAKRRARKQYTEDPDSKGTGSFSRLMNLTPKQQDGRFYPRIDGTVVSPESCDTPTQAVDASLAFLHNRAARP